MMPLSMALPPQIAYRLACIHGEREYQQFPWIHNTVPDNLASTFGETFSAAERQSIALEYARLRRCDAVDRLQFAASPRRGRALMAMKGVEHLREALGAGKGALICTAHFGSFLAAACRLSVEGFPVSVIRAAFAEEAAEPGLSRVERFRRKALARRFLAHYLQESIVTGDGQFTSGVQAARRLRQNEVIISLLDPPPPAQELARAVEAPFINQTTRLLTGSITIAQRLGTPILVMLVHRSPDYQHSTLELSAPIMPEPTPEATLARCLAPIADAIRVRPAEWFFWPRTHTLRELGLLPPVASSTHVSEPQQPTAPIMQ
jgi:lauroyl/myristoyl acyltransferase